MAMPRGLARLAGRGLPRLRVGFALLLAVGVAIWRPVAGQGREALVRFKRGQDLTERRVVLDSWTPFEQGGDGDGGASPGARLGTLLVPGAIVLGSWVRAQGALPRAKADSMRRITFMLMLPAFLLRHIWLVQLDSQLYAVAAWSFAFHSLWFSLSMHGARRMEPVDRQMRGWTMMMSQGAMNSFLYPLLLGNSAFGEKSLACAVLWDMGGNMWICQFALFAIAAFFKPNEHRDTEVTVNGIHLVGKGHGDADEEETEVLLEKNSVLSPLDGAIAASKAMSEWLPREIVIDALRQPVLIGCVVGFVMNLAGAPLPWLLDTPLLFIGEPYKLLLYFLVGFYGDYNLTSSDVRRLASALGLRYAVCVGIIASIMAVFPFEPLYRYTVALALMSPCSSYCMFLIGEHGYGEALMRLTVCGGFVSTIISTVIQTLAIELLAGSGGT